MSPGGLLLITHDSNNYINAYLTNNLEKSLANFRVIDVKEVTFTTYKTNPVALILAKEGQKDLILTAIYLNDKGEWTVAKSRIISENTTRLSIGKVSGADNLYIISHLDHSVDYRIVYNYLSLEGNIVKLSDTEFDHPSHVKRNLVGIKSFMIADNFYTLWMEKLEAGDQAHKVNISYGVALGTETEKKEFTQTRKFEIKETASFDAVQEGFSVANALMECENPVLEEKRHSINCAFMGKTSVGFVMKFEINDPSVKKESTPEPAFVPTGTPDEEEVKPVVVTPKTEEEKPAPETPALTLKMGLKDDSPVFLSGKIIGELQSPNTHRPTQLIYRRGYVAATLNIINSSALNQNTVSG